MRHCALQLGEVRPSILPFKVQKSLVFFGHFDQAHVWLDFLLLDFRVMFFVSPLERPESPVHQVIVYVVSTAGGYWVLDSIHSVVVVS